ncbi:hypothetical protein L226DRAFT_527534 [Lentinus tigrinus ALCF2SS1-7]|uniref:Uncharacterized protein n=1 Tax=Lentinus tigrinus ALCF2SS1-6 TaxID=1328759 RepID=A0A5C2RT48_9APHY|nr:hypothetical protein L227DRAFT_567980 [Lentinus tigrinus ALCF2SS1-6]RPD54878.1 hypothetical protein L227DRAFT_566947 [Lentinus tigrinus ALCF2SS1-6]RPD67974.1 hypothetical protein L226DRAFT_527534 [Lentinus tigrinus ALCF2SS1-7]
MVAASRIVAPDTIDQKMYHPSLADAVRAVLDKGIKLKPFPAMVVIDQLDDVEQWLIDNAQVKAKPCDSCKEEGVLCILHNEMQDLGHPPTVRTLPYKTAKKLGLTPVPQGYKWASKRDQPKDLLRRLEKRYAARAEVEGTGEGSGDNTENEVDELADDDDNEPPPATQPKRKGKARAEPRTRTSVSNADILRAIEEMNDNVKELLAELKRKRDANDGQSEDSGQSPEPAEGSSKRGRTEPEEDDEKTA